jgi:hypothetical protein
MSVPIERENKVHTPILTNGTPIPCDANIDEGSNSEMDEEYLLELH